MPKRLYWRAAIILLFPVIFLQLIVSVVIIKPHFEGVTEQMTRTVASQIELIATTVEKTEIETALNLSKSLNMELFKIGTTDQKVLNRRRFYDVSGIVVIRELYDLKWVQNVDLLDDDYVTVTLKLAGMDFQLRFAGSCVGFKSSSINCKYGRFWGFFYFNCICIFKKSIETNHAISFRCRGFRSRSDSSLQRIRSNRGQGCRKCFFRNAK